MTTTNEPYPEVLALLERARYDVERGWLAAAFDALTRAAHKLRKAHAL